MIKSILIGALLIASASAHAKHPTIEDLDKKLTYLTNLLYKQQLQSQRDKRLITENNLCHEQCSKQFSPWPEYHEHETPFEIDSRDRFVKASQACHASCKELPPYFQGMGC